MAPPTNALPPAPVPYQYDAADHAIQLVGDAQALLAAIEHMKLRAPRYEAVTGSRGGAKAGAVGLLALAVMPRALIMAGSGNALPIEVLTVWMQVSPLLGLGGIALGVWAMVGRKGGKFTPDPTVSEGVVFDDAASSLVRALVPGSYELTARFARMISGNTFGTGTSRSFGLTMRLAQGFSQRIDAGRASQTSSSRDGNLVTTTTTSSVETVFMALPPQLPADIAARINAAGPTSLPQFPHVAPTEVAVVDGAVRLTVKSRHGLMTEMLVAYANAAARVAGFPSPMFNA